MNPDNRVEGGNDCMSSRPGAAAPSRCLDPACAACCGGAPQQQPPNACTALNTKLEPANLPQYICVPKLCSIFGGHDTNYYPENHDTCPSPRSRHKNVNLNSLGSPVGLVKSSIVIKSSEAKPSELHPQRFATYLKAFAKIYLTPENGWNTAAVDRLLKEGQELFAESNKFKMEDDVETNEIYSNSEAKIIRSFELDGSAFHVELNKKFQLIPLESNGDAPIPDLQIDILRSALKAFFRQSRYCLIKVTNWYMMLWKSRGVYFVFDFYGRRVNDFVTDREKGVAMLICLKTLDNVHHLIANLSGLHKGDPFNLREMKVVKLTGPDGKTMNREYGKRINQYEVISADYAFLKSALHLTLNKADPLRNRSALPVAVAALLASKIDHPATWNQKIVDKIICYGVNICRLCWEQCLNANEPIDLEKFPNQLKLGQFLAQYTLTPRFFEGTWKCVPNYKHSELALSLEKCFEMLDNYLLVQVGFQIYAVWKKNNFIYLFDPYRHRIDINTPPTTNDDGKEHKSATVRMFRSFEIFLGVFTQLLLESNRTTTFYVHRLQICRIRLADRSSDGAGVCAAELMPELDQIDVKSLNETICFEEDETKCMEELGEISDFEDDDITSSVMQMDIKEPKSETDESEEDMEEEEGGIEDLGEYESSSSGDGGGHGKHRKKKDKKGKNKDGKSKKDKADKGKKGKGKGDDGTKKRKKKDKSDDESSKKKKKNDRDSDDKDGKKKKKKGDGSSDDDDADGKKKKKTTDDADESKRTGKAGDDDGKSSKDGDDGKLSKDGDGKNKSDGDRRGQGDDGDGFGGKGGQSGASDKDRYGDTTDGDENDDGGYGKGKVGNCNKYPGYTSVPYDMAVVGSESGTYESICRLLRAAFRCADRMLLMTPWGNYVVFRAFNMFKKQYYLFDGCTCNVNRFRHLDLNCGTAGLLCFPNLHDIICYIIDSQEIRTCMQRSRKNVVDEICRQYCRQ